MRAAADMHRLVSPAVAAVICALLVGCSESEPQEETSNLRLLSVLYGQYRAEHRGQVPANEQDFKAFAAAKINNPSSESDVVNVDELFISGRDGKPFAVKYRGDKAWPLPEAIAYEQDGSGGTRHVATVDGGQAEMSEEEFRNAKSAPGAPQ
jgi:hypothetical protein